MKLQCLHQAHAKVQQRYQILSIEFSRLKFKHHVPFISCSVFFLVPCYTPFRFQPVRVFATLLCFQVVSEEGNFGSLPPKDKQMVIDGANVAWYFTDSTYFCTKVVFILVLVPHVHFFVSISMTFRLGLELFT